MLTVPEKEKERQRFWVKVNIGQPNECWTWNASTASDGYSTFSLNGKQAYAHRYAYEDASGPVPAGLLVCHSCDNPPCTNPAHLWVGTHSQNIQDAIAKGRFTPATNPFNAMNSIRHWLYATGGFYTVEEIAAAFSKPRHWVERRIGLLIQRGQVHRYHSKPLARYASVIHA